MIDIEVFSKAGIGKDNEDYVLHSEISPDVTLIVVCDGMGGLSYGLEAAKIVAHSIEQYLRQNLCSQEPCQSISDAMFYANDNLSTECRRIKAKMGASIGLTLFVGNHLFSSWVGDVRIHLKKGDHTDLLTKDHLALEGNHSFLARCINGREFRYSPIVEDMTLHLDEEIAIATDGYYLHNKIGSSIELVTVHEDDATLVCLKMRE